VYDEGNPDDGGEACADEDGADDDGTLLKANAE
jgi:hypothetical protein